MLYAIHEDLLPKLEKTLNRIKNKCEKYNLPFIYKVNGEEFRTIEDEDGNEKIHKFFIIEVEGMAIVNNYEVIAEIEHTSNGNIIHAIKEGVEIPEKYRNTSSLLCEHCHTKIYRKSLYLVYNHNTNKYKQVGKSCLREYTMGLDADYVTQFYNGLTTLSKFDGYIGEGCGDPYNDNDEVLKYAVEVIEKMGYIKCNTDEPITTKYLINELLRIGSIDYFTRKEITVKEVLEKINTELAKYGYLVRFTKEDINKPATKKTIEKIKEYYLSLEPITNFIHNTQVLLKNGYHKCSNVGMLVYLPQGYFNHIKKEIAKAERQKLEEKKVNEYFGEVGKRYKEEKIIDIKEVYSFGTIYGESYIYIITLESGHVLSWTTANFYCREELDKIKTITFTIKEHKEYKEQKQTRVTRCKLA